MAAQLSDFDLASLAIHAQTRNETLGITGTLFLAGDHVVQNLEGDRAAVDWLYRVIAEDPRHRDVVKVLDTPLERRAFEGWFMRLMTADDISEPGRSMVLRPLHVNDNEGPLEAPPPSADFPGVSPFLAARLTSGILGPQAGRRHYRAAPSAG